MEFIIKCAKEHKLANFYEHFGDCMDPRVTVIINEIIARKAQIVDAEYIVGDRESKLGTAVDLLLLCPENKIACIEIKTVNVCF